MTAYHFKKACISQCLTSLNVLKSFLEILIFPCLKKRIWNILLYSEGCTHVLVRAHGPANGEKIKQKNLLRFTREWEIVKHAVDIFVRLQHCTLAEKKPLSGEKAKLWDFSKKVKLVSETFYLLTKFYMCVEMYLQIQRLEEASTDDDTSLFVSRAEISNLTVSSSLFLQSQELGKMRKN